MGELPAYEEDSWFDEWDWESSTEPAITYKDAISRLQALTQGRADVRVEWDSGRRGPREDARIVFAAGTGTRDLRVRVRSASQFDDFSRIVDSVSLLIPHRAAWYPGNQLITARLVGDYDQFHAAVAQELVPAHKNRNFDPDSPLGADVAGMLASSGAFAVVEEAARSGLQPRSIRLVRADDDLRLLYGPRIREVPAVAIELAGFAVPDTTRAEEVLLEYGTAYLFEIAKATGVSLRLWRPEHQLSSQRRQPYSRKVRFPKLRYDPQPAELYSAGNSAARDPVERYLKYYQVLEFYMTRAADYVAKSQGVTVKKATSPLRKPPNNQLVSEQNKLDAVISLALKPDQVMRVLKDRELLAVLNNPGVIRDVERLITDASGEPVAGYDYREDVSTRVYAIRNRIVHMKEGGGKGGKHLLAPYGREARDLGADLRLIRFLAEHIMKFWSTTLP